MGERRNENLKGDIPECWKGRHLYDFECFLQNEVRCVCKKTMFLIERPRIVLFGELSHLKESQIRVRMANLRYLHPAIKT